MVKLTWEQEDYDGEIKVFSHNSNTLEDSEDFWNRLEYSANYMNVYLKRLV